MDLYSCQKQQFKIKSFLFHNMLTDGLEWCGLLVILLSAVWTLILTAPIHCRGSTGEQVMDAEFLQICSDEETHLHLGWPEV